MVLDSDARKKMNFPTKLFCISIAVEPLMFFVMTDPHQSGWTITLSRCFQILVCLYFCAYVIKKGLILPIANFRYYYLYFIYLLIGLLSSALGALFYGSYILTSNEINEVSSWTIATIIRGTYSRPFFEIVIAFYYFIYFVIAPKYVLQNKFEIKYLLDLQISLFKIGLVLGILDVIQFLVSGMNFIPRHLIDSDFVELGTRYHGFAGEPRDAFPYLVFGLAVYYLRSSLFNLKSPPKLLICLTILALLLTQSTSGLIGVVIAIFIYITAEFKISISFIIKLAFRLLLAIALIYIVIRISDRIMDYITASEGLFDVLWDGDDLNPYMAAQSVNIYPLVHFFRSLFNLDLFPVFFGFGFGSVSFINNNLGSMDGLANPHSNAVRLLCEVGILGMWFYVASQLLLIRNVRNILFNRNRKIFYLLAVLLLGLCLGHRSTTIFILCGISFAILSFRNETY
jgi:hypothetical protein